VSQWKVAPWMGKLAVGGAVMAFFWLERRHPLRHSKPEPDRKRLAQNSAMAAATAVVIHGFERPLVQPVAQWVDRQNAGLLPMLGLPPLPEKALSIVLADNSLYQWHILLHRVPFLWRIHVVHHADLMLGTSTALRFHFLEFLASIPCRLGQVLVQGRSPDTLALWHRLTLIEVLFHHSNVGLPIEVERKLRKVLVTPRLLGIHHSTRPRETGSNFSSGLSLWDAMHATLKRGIP
jgi:sterol desaturase/sphingolipid hydroxylase (fatty acid hydroxylase superfamily)